MKWGEKAHKNEKENIIKIRRLVNRCLLVLFASRERLTPRSRKEEKPYLREIYEFN